MSYGLVNKFRRERRRDAVVPKMITLKDGQKIPLRELPLYQKAFGLHQNLTAHQATTRALACATFLSVGTTVLAVGLFSLCTGITSVRRCGFFSSHIYSYIDILSYLGKRITTFISKTRVPGMS